MLSSKHIRRSPNNFHFAAVKTTCQSLNSFSKHLTFPSKTLFETNDSIIIYYYYHHTFREGREGERKREREREREKWFVELSLQFHGTSLGMKIEKDGSHFKQFLPSFQDKPINKQINVHSEFCKNGPKETLNF